MSADLVVLNKADLVDNDQLKALQAQIAGAVPRAVKIAPAREGAIGADVLLGMQRRGRGRSRRAPVASRRRRRARSRRFRHVRRYNSRGPRSRHADRSPRRGDARARHPARQRLRRSRRQADADAGAGRGAALPSRLRPALGRERAASEPSRRDRSSEESTARPSPRRSAPDGLSGDARPPHRNQDARRDRRSARSRPDAGGHRVPVLLRQRPQRAGARL